MFAQSSPCVVLYTNLLLVINTQRERFRDCRELVALLGKAVAGMHGMIDEHFGISVVEYMAAGAIPIGQTLKALSHVVLIQLFLS